MKKPIPTANFPVLCPDCLTSVQMDAADGISRYRIKFCIHNMALALINVHIGAIMDWQMIGPVSVERAIELTDKLRATHKQVGGIELPDSTTVN